MNNVKTAIVALSGQQVRIDLTSRWPNGYKARRSLIGTLRVEDELFTVEETVGEGRIVTALPYCQASFVRIDNDTGGAFCAVIEATNGEQEE